MDLPLVLLSALALGVIVVEVLLALGSRWGSSATERALALPGDDWLAGERRPRVVLTRAVAIAARPEEVWPFLAQLGRGAGW